MSKSNLQNDEVLDQETLELLGSELKPADLPPERMDKLRARIMDSIDDAVATPIGFVTIRATEGHWEEIAPRIHKKVLHLDPVTGAEAYLLRAEPGAETPPHEHEHDELCLVLEGEVEFDNVHLKTGDYHFAPKGSLHSSARTQTGAVVFIQTGLMAA